MPANHPDLIRIVWIFELQNLKKSGHSDFLREKKTFSLENKLAIFDTFVVRAVTCSYRCMLYYVMYHLKDWF